MRRHRALRPAALSSTREYSLVEAEQGPETCQPHGGLASAAAAARHGRRSRSNSLVAGRGQGRGWRDAIEPKDLVRPCREQQAAWVCCCSHGPGRERCSACRRHGFGICAECPHLKARRTDKTEVKRLHKWSDPPAGLRERCERDQSTRATRKPGLKGDFPTGDRPRSWK